MNLDRLINRIQQEHRSYGEELPSIIRRVAEQIPIPPDLLAFYERVGRGASLFDEKYRIVGIDDLKRVPRVPHEWYSFCDVGDGDVVAYDAATLGGESYDVLDCFHETVHDNGETVVIARSFNAFLKLALESGGSLYWLEDGFREYGNV